MVTVDRLAEAAVEAVSQLTTVPTAAIVDPWEVAQEPLAVADHPMVALVRVLMHSRTHPVGVTLAGEHHLQHTPIKGTTDQMTISPPTRTRISRKKSLTKRM